jgi:Flp pilus assembly protein TadD
MSRREARRWVAATCILGAAVVSVVGAEPRPAPRDPSALRARAEGLVVRGEVGEALDLATLAANLAPNDPESWRVLAKMHSAAGHDEDHLSSVR